MSLSIARVWTEHSNTDAPYALHIRARLRPPPIKGSVVRYAAAPPLERRASYSGSGMPYVDERTALEGSGNRGETDVVDSKGRFEAVLPQGAPGVYLAPLGQGGVVPPTLHVAYNVAVGVVNVSAIIPM